MSDSNDQSRLMNSFQKGSEGRGATMWKSCCLAAIDCCRSQLSSSGVEIEMESNNKNNNNNLTTAGRERETLSSSSSSCPSTWDGWTCWSRTRSNSTATTRCPNYIYFETESPPCNRKLLAFFFLPSIISSWAGQSVSQVK